MKINIRRSVFETNSSSMHTYTFVKQDINSDRNPDDEVFAGWKKKANLIDWVFGETDLAGCMFLALEESDYAYRVCPGIDDYPYRFSWYPPAFRTTFCKLCNADESISDSQLTAIAADIIEQNEEEFFRDPDFSYKKKISPDSMSADGTLEDTLSDKERLTLALKAGLVMTYDNASPSENVFENTFFAELLEKRVNYLDTTEVFDYGYLFSQMMKFYKLEAILERVRKEYYENDTSPDKDKPAYVEIDGLLCDYYDMFDTFFHLGLKLTSYPAFEKSLRDFLSDNSKIIVAY